MNSNQNYFDVGTQSHRNTRLSGLEMSERELWLECIADDDVNLREWVAGYSRTPVEIMQILVNDDSATVRVKLAGNQTCPIFILELLLLDRDAYVRFCAMKTIKASQSLSRLMPACKAHA